MPPKHVTIETCSLTDCSKAIANRFKLNKQRCHRPARTTRLKKAYKTNSLASNSRISNSRKKCNALTQSKACSTCNCRKKWHQSKSVADCQEKKQNRQPYYCCFSTGKRISSPSRGQTISRRKSNSPIIISLSIRKAIRTSHSLAPFQMNAFQCLSVPKKTNRFTKTRKSTIERESSRMITRMISSQNQNSDCHSLKPIV